MVLKITVYGYVKVRGDSRSYALIDMTYFLDGQISVRDVLDIVNQSGFDMIPHRYNGQVTQDKVTIESLDIGIEPYNGPQEPQQPQHVEYL
jgi:hypothetical protein